MNERRVRARRWRHVRWIGVVFCVAVGLGVVGVSVWARHITAPQRPPLHWRAALPGVDLGMDTRSAAIGQEGAIELWAYPHQADDYLPLLRLPGAPALKAPPKLLPGEVSV